jgi:hypothetical protein
MTTKLTWKDWLWPIVYFVVFFLLIPFIFHVLADYRNYGTSSEATSLAKALAANFGQDISTAADVFEADVTSTDIIMDETARSVSSTNSLCAALSDALKSRTAEYTLPPNECFFDVKKFNSWFQVDPFALRAADSGMKSLMDQAAAELNPFSLEVAKDESGKGEQKGVYLVRVRVKSDPLTIFGFTIQHKPEIPLD